MTSVIIDTLKSRRTGRRRCSCRRRYIFVVVDGRAAVLLIHRDRVHRAGAHAGTARTRWRHVAGLRAHAALTALVRVDDRALMGHGNRAESAGLQAALRHAVLAVAGDGVALQGAPAGAVHNGDRLIGGCSNGFRRRTRTRGRRPNPRGCARPRARGTQERWPLAAAAQFPAE